MRYEIAKLSVYVDNSKSENPRKFTIFYHTKREIVFKVCKHIENTQLHRELRYPKFLNTEKYSNSSAPLEEVRTLTFGEYTLTFGNSVIKIED